MAPVACAVTRGVEEWSVWSTTARLVTSDPAAVEAGRRIVERELAAIDAAASRFRPDSEVVRLAAASGRPVTIGPLLAELVAVALDAAQQTDGAVDPTLGAELAALGYDRDICLIRGSSSRRTEHPPVNVRRRAGWRDVELEGLRLSVPAGMVLDLGATAKAWAADRCACLVAESLGGAALVSLGGDLRVAGGEVDDWTILVQDGPDEPASLISLGTARGVATSSILGRSWTRWNQRMHHVLDPVTCRPAPEVWRSVTVAAGSCLTANTMTTAALVKGVGAPLMLRDGGLPSRLVRADGHVTTLNGWPAS